MDELLKMCIKAGGEINRLKITNLCPKAINTEWLTKIVISQNINEAYAFVHIYFNFQATILYDCEILYNKIIRINDLLLIYTLIEIIRIKKSHPNL